MTTYAWLLEYQYVTEGPTGEVRPLSPPLYYGTDGFSTQNAHEAKRFGTAEEARLYVAAKDIRHVNVLEHGFWQEDT